MKGVTDFSGGSCPPQERRERSGETSGAFASVVSLPLVILLFSPALVCLAQSPDSRLPAPPSGRRFVKGEILVKMKKGASLRSLAGLGADLGLGKRKAAFGKGLLRVGIAGGVSEEEAARALMERAAEYIEYAEPNYLLYVSRYPNDPRFDEMYALHNTGQNGGSQGADVDAVDAWDIVTGGDVVVAVVDSGVDYDHSDLAANMWTNASEIPDNGIDDDGNGFVDDHRGWDFFNEDSDPDDDHSHGTHCAGIIAARGDNGIGVVGVNWSARIMPLKFICADGWGSTADAIRAIDYATAMGASVISCSWGGANDSRALKEAIEAAGDAGVIVVAAAGNEGANNDESPFYPASYDCANIISVAAADRNDLLASFSSWGQTSVDLAAPGDSVISTLPGDGYGGKSGTSAAAPHVAGAAALVWAYRPTWSPAQVISAILQGVEECPSLAGKVATGGRLDLLRMLDPDASLAPIATATPMPAPDPRSHMVALELNGSDFREGDELRLAARVTYGWLSPYAFCDAYVAVAGPDGRIFFLSAAGEWSSGAVPFAEGFRVEDMSADIGRFRIPPGLPEGDYAWYAVLTPPQNGPLRATAWASNLSEAPFDIGR